MTFAKDPAAQPTAQAIEDTQSNLQLLLRWLGISGPETPHRRPDRLYPPGIPDLWSRAAIQRDLWARACNLAGRKLISHMELQLWGYWYGVSDGGNWSHAEIRRRFGLGRDFIDRRLAMVTSKVAHGLLSNPPSATPTLSAHELDAADIEEAVAIVHGRAVTESRRHQVEEYKAAHDLLKGECVPHPARRNQANADGLVKRDLKTSRHLPRVHAQINRTILDVAARRALPYMRPGLVIMPLWEPVEPRTNDLEETYDQLLLSRSTGSLAEIATALRDGHHQIMHGNTDRQLTVEFLLEETYVLRDSYNITALPILDLLERFISPRDHRWVAIARERAHLLEVHYHWAAAARWITCAEARLNHPGVRWDGPEHKLIEAINITYRKLTQQIDNSLVCGRLPRSKTTSLRRLIDDLPKYLQDSSHPFLEWSHLARRYDLQRQLSIRAVERHHGLKTSWTDSELARLDEVDQEVAGLSRPARILSWGSRRLSILLEANRPREFMATLVDLYPVFQIHGPASPNQISTLSLVIKAARKRRGGSWSDMRHDLHDLLICLPKQSDDMLRHPLAIPRPLFIGGVPLL
jgi:hypothetical protein